jgi:mono/diheme cytochrome c family protein
MASIVGCDVDCRAPQVSLATTSSAYRGARSHGRWAQREDELTEIPEHLLKRSKERRAAMGEGGGDAEATPTTEASTPGTAVTPAKPAVAPATPAPAAPPKPIPAYVQAAKVRRKIPFWAMPVLAALPIWMFIYAEAMQPNPAKLTGPLAVGSTEFSNCSSCHGGGGEGGGVGPKLAEGEVRKSFPTFEAQYSFVATGSQPYVGKPYGAAGKIGIAGMPSWKANELTASQIMAVVCHERFTLAGITDTTVPSDQLAEFTKYCAADAPEYAKAQEDAEKYPLYASPPDVSKK